MTGPMALIRGRWLLVGVVAVLSAVAMAVVMSSLRGGGSAEQSEPATTAAFTNAEALPLAEPDESADPTAGGEPEMVPVPLLTPSAISADAAAVALPPDISALAAGDIDDPDIAAILDAADDPDALLVEAANAFAASQGQPRHEVLLAAREPLEPPTPGETAARASDESEVLDVVGLPDGDSGEAPAEPSLEVADEEGPAPGPVDGGPADEVLIDVCAEVEGWCDEGVGATVLLAMEVPIEVFDVAAEPTAACRSELGTADDAYVLEIRTNRPGWFDVRIEGPDRGPLLGTQVATSAAASERWELERSDTAEVVVAQTCIALTGSQRQPAYWVEIDAAREEGSGTEDRWEGWVLVDDRGDRPPVRVTPTSDRTVRVVVPTTPTLATAITITPLDSIDDPVEWCRDVDPSLLSRLAPERFATAMDRTGFDPAYSVDSVHEPVGVDRPSVACVLWDAGRFDVVEREAILVEPPARPVVTVSVGDFTPNYLLTRRSELGTRPPSQVWVTMPELRGCDSVVDVPSFPATVALADIDSIEVLAIGPQRMCDFSYSSSPGVYEVMATPLFNDGGPAYENFRAAVNLPVDGCRAGGDCEFRVPVDLVAQIEPPLPGARARVGRIDVLFGFAFPSGGRTTWYTESLGAAGADVEPSDLPVLSSVGTRLLLRPDCESGPNPVPWCWARQANVQWAADRPVVIVAAIAMPLRTGSFGPIPFMCPVVHQRPSSRTSSAISGEFGFSTPLCPGTDYELGLLVEDAATQRRVRYLPTLSSDTWALNELEAAGDYNHRVFDVGLRTPNIVVRGNWNVGVSGLSRVGDDRLRGMRIVKLEVSTAGARVLERGSEYGTDDCGAPQTFTSDDAGRRQQQITLSGQTWFRIVAEFEFRSECNEFRRFFRRTYGGESAARIEVPSSVECQFSYTLLSINDVINRLERGLQDGIGGRCRRPGSPVEFDSAATRVQADFRFFIEPEPPIDPPARGVGVERR